MMNREQLLSALEKESLWDFIIIGGGATGLGTAVEAASRGHKTLLLEQHDFSKGTSSRSTKLVHGGVRYLQQGNISLVLEALHERGLLMENAPHLVRHLAFVVPNYDWWEGPFYGIGLKVYDMLAGKLGLGPSQFLSREETLKRIPTVEPNGLRGGVVYYDGQFDDSRLAINLAQTAFDLGATPLNYMRVSRLLKDAGMVTGIEALDRESNTWYKLYGRVVVNATGVFSGNIMKMDNPRADDVIVPSQGVHLVLDKKFLPGDSAIMVPHTDDGRVLFAVPWHDKVILGTTDTPVENSSLEPRALDEEIQFLLKHAVRYLTGDPTPKDVRSVFAGLRPLVKTGDTRNTAALSRDHVLMVSPAGLVTITGGKWTTYRKMAEDTVNEAELVAGLDSRPSVTSHTRVHGYQPETDPEDPLRYYGADAEFIKEIMKENPRMAKRLHASCPFTGAEVVWAVRAEMARTVEDVLARRIRALFLDALASISMAPVVAEIMAEELNKPAAWKQEQISAYHHLARGYLIK